MSSKSFASAAIFAALSLFGAMAGAGLFEDADAVLQVVGKGEVNWTDRVIRAPGSGTPDVDTANIAIARLGAERAAKLDAIRNIMETIRGIQVDSYTTAEDYITTSGYVRSRVEIATRGARIVEKRYLPDGGIEVVVEITIAGDLIEALVPQTGGLTVPSTGDQYYTGLIVDATGLGVRPAMAPRIVDGWGREIYGPSYVSRESAVSSGIAGYSSDLSAARESERVGETPLVIKGVRASGPGSSDIVISGTDAAALRDNSRNFGFLERCRVIIVVD